MTDLQKFFDAVRANPFGGKLLPGQVQGCEAILRACERHGVTDDRFEANTLSQVHHETGGQMLPVKETVQGHHKNRNPSDAEVIRRLDTAFAQGNLPWVTKPYWRDGAFGRGGIQITHWSGYDKLGRRLGIDLRGNPELALDLDISADIAVVGMAEGLFTGKKLGDYFSDTRDDPAGARAIVNGDGREVGPKIVPLHRAFLAALRAARANPVQSWLAAAPAPVATIKAWLAAKPGGATL